MRLLRRNLASAYTAYGISILSGLITVPIVVRAVGKEGYGIWAFVGSIVVFFNLLDLGVGPTVVRFGAAYRGRGTTEETSALASAGLFLYGIVTLVSIPAAVGAAWAVPAVLGVGDDLVWPARIVTLLMIGTVIVRFPLGLAGNLLLAHQRWDVVNAANVVGALAYLGLVAGLLLDHRSLVVLGGIAFGTHLLRLALPLAWLRHELPDLRVRRSLITRERLRELLSFSWHNFLLHLASKVVFSTDVLIVGLLLGPIAAALYGIPARLFGLAFGAGSAATDLLYPALSELEGREDMERQRALVIQGLRLGLALIAVIALPLVLIPDLLIEAWIGPGFGESVPVTALLGAALLLHLPAHVLAQYLVARARQRDVALVSVGVVTANVALSVGLALWVGIWGVALATVVTEAAFVLVILPRLVAAAAGPSPGELLRAVARPLAAAGLAAGVVLGGVGRTLEPETLAGLVPVGLLWVVVAGAAVWLLGLETADRAAIVRRAAPGRATAALEAGSDPLGP